MEFILLVFLNIIILTVFYLILRLKLEKYASDYREQRLRREMDEIINEFNDTAERNITILENRIEVLKKLLEKSGIINYIDIKIDNDKREETANKAKRINNNISDAFEELDSVIVSDENVIIKSDKKNFEKRLKEDSSISYVSDFFLKIRAKLKDIIIVTYNIIFRFKHNSSKLNNNIFNLNDNYNVNNEVLSKLSHDSDLQKEISNIALEKEEQSSNRKLKDIFELTEFELEKMFSTSDDKYLLIPELYDKGYPVELISKCSGIPIGEIKLVLDLNNSI